MIVDLSFLGTDVGDSRLHFGECQNGKISLAEEMANLTFSIMQDHATN